jgi:hypothetical protein
LKTLLTRYERTERGEGTMVLRKLISAVVPGAQPFRMMGKGLPGRGSGSRLADRK